MLEVLQQPSRFIFIYFGIIKQFFIEISKIVNFIFIEPSRTEFTKWFDNQNMLKKTQGHTVVMQGREDRQELKNYVIE